MARKQHDRQYDLVVFGASGESKEWPSQAGVPPPSTGARDRRRDKRQETDPRPETTPGYTGKYTAQYIATHLPTDLRWAVAGRSQAKLEQVAAECRRLNADRAPPAIEVCGLDGGDAGGEEMARLARKTLVLITTVGPYGRLGEPAFRACAENGTHYLDVTGEVPFVARMLRKYEAAARASGALMFPQIGVESAPADLVTWSLAACIRSEFGAPTRDVIVSLHNIR